jgi:spore coat protein U-like protein
MTVSGTGTSSDFTVYGRIPARQNASVGSYSDTITVTITF